MARFINHLLSQAALERSLADEALTVYREINLLNEISLKLTSLLEIETLTKAVLDFAKKIKGADNTSILLLDEDNETLTIIAATGQEFSPKTELKAGEGIAGHILMSGKAEIINDVERDSCRHPIFFK